MIFDPVRRVYVRPDGSVVSPSELRQLIENYIEQEKSEIDREAELLLAGTITAAFFFDWLREKIKEVHGAAGLTAYGGEDQMNPERWGRIGKKVASETAYVAGFQQEFVASEQIAKEIVSEAVKTLEAYTSVSQKTVSAIEKVVRTTAPASDIPVTAEALASHLGVETEIIRKTFTEAANAERMSRLVFGQTRSRATHYADAAYATHENSTRDRESDAGVIRGRRVTEGDSRVCDGCEGAATDEYIPLDEISDIGIFECGSSDRCTIEFDYYGVEPLRIERSIYAPGFA